jgi:hypothetical protein
MTSHRALLYLQMELASYHERELADTNSTTPKKVSIGARMVSHMLPEPDEAYSHIDECNIRANNFSSFSLITSLIFL